MTPTRSARVLLAVLLPVAASSMAVGKDAVDVPALKVDFSYAFATPHRIAIGRPEASDRTLLDVQPGSLCMAWSYDNLAMPNYPLLALKTPPTTWRVQIMPKIDGKPPACSRWTRLDAVLPALDNSYADPKGSVRLAAIGGVSAALIRIEIANTDSKPHQFAVHCDLPQLCENPAWLDSKRFPGDHILAGWGERADRVVILGIGAETYSCRGDNLPPSSKSMVLAWNLKPGQKGQGWIVRPYNGYAADVPALRKRDWAQEMEHGKREWRELLARVLKISIPDRGVANSYLACFGDLFIMREPMQGGFIGSVPGSEGYRAGNSGEAAIVAVALDQNGFHKEAAEGYKVSLEMQAPDGNWADYKGWMHGMWCSSGFKCLTIMEHYRLTGDKQYLAEVYPRMLASSRWQEHQRATMRPAGDNRPLTYGLMPRGFGDCGLVDGTDNYGVFLPHNIWAVYADRCCLEAAEILGKTTDIEEVKKIYQTAYDDLMAALDRGAIREKGYRWIPGVAGKTDGCRWGALNAVFPCRLLPPRHELIAGTLKKIESNVSKGGQPLHTGWMPNGAWVAITLDNIAEVHLMLANGDAAAKYLYSTLNHGTPLYTWCEERGQEPGTSTISGDRQHLWTPVAVVRFIRDMLVMENGDGLDLAIGTARQWLGSGKTVGIADAPTHFGRVSYQLRYDKASSSVGGEVLFPEDSKAAWAVLHIRLPGGLKVKSVDAGSKAAVLPDGSGIRWTAPRGALKVQAGVGE